MQSISQTSTDVFLDVFSGSTPGQVHNTCTTVGPICLPGIRYQSEDQAVHNDMTSI